MNYLIFSMLIRRCWAVCFRCEKVKIFLSPLSCKERMMHVKNIFKMWQYYLLVCFWYILSIGRLRTGKSLFCSSRVCDSISALILLKAVPLALWLGDTGKIDVLEALKSCSPVSLLALWLSQPQCTCSFIYSLRTHFPIPPLLKQCHISWGKVTLFADANGFTWCAHTPRNTGIFLVLTKHIHIILFGWL